jgi:hypothetical protein
MFGLLMQQMRLWALRRLPIAFGWLTKRGDPATARWIKPAPTTAGASLGCSRRDS